MAATVSPGTSSSGWYDVDLDTGDMTPCEPAYAETFPTYNFSDFIRGLHTAPTTPALSRAGSTDSVSSRGYALCRVVSGGGETPASRVEVAVARAFTYFPVPVLRRCHSAPQ